MVLPWGSPTSSEPPHLWLFIGPWVMWSLVKITYLEWSPPKHSIYFYLTYILTSYLAFSLAYILWHIFWHFFCNFLAGKRRRGQLWWNLESEGFLLTFYSANLMTFLLAAYVFGISSGIFCIHIWYIFGNSLWLRSGGQHSAPGLAVWVRRGTLRSSACSWGLAGNTPILILLFGSSGEHCDLALVVAVRRWSLWSWACCPGPAGTRAIKSLQLRSGRDDFDPEVAVRVRRGPLRARACSWGPAEEQEAEEAAEAAVAGQQTWNLTTLTRQVGKKHYSLKVLTRRYRYIYNRTEPKWNWSYTAI